MVQELGVDQFAAQDFQGFPAGLASGDGEVQVSGWLDQVLRFLLFLALVFASLVACPTAATRGGALRVLSDRRGYRIRRHR
ncbi:hypothetical protein ACE6JH_35600 [Streptomyces nigra]